MGGASISILWFQESKYFFFFIMRANGASISILWFQEMEIDAPVTLTVKNSCWKHNMEIDAPSALKIKDNCWKHNMKIDAPSALKIKDNCWKHNMEIDAPSALKIAVETVTCAVHCKKYFLCLLIILTCLPNHQSLRLPKRATEATNTTGRIDKQSANEHGTTTSSIVNKVNSDHVNVIEFCATPTCSQCYYTRKILQHQQRHFRWSIPLNCHATM